MTQIHKIGFELEGEFSGDLIRQLRDIGVIVGNDGSIGACRKGHDEMLHTQEIRTKPYVSPRRLEAIIEKVAEGEQAGEYHWNKSMGFHIHISFIDRKTKSNVPQEVWSSAFNKFFLEKAQATFKADYKAREGNHYCKAIKDRTDADMATGYDRYMAINYAPAFRSHGTIEFRLWPANSAEKLLRYFRFTVATVGEFLSMADDILQVQESTGFSKKERVIGIKQIVEKVTEWSNKEYDGQEGMRRTKKVLKLFTAPSRFGNYNV